MFRESCDIVGHPDFHIEAGKRLQVAMALVGVLNPVWATKSSGVLILVSSFVPMHGAGSCVKSKVVSAPANAVGIVQWGWVTSDSLQTCGVHEQSHDLPLIYLLFLFPTSVCVNLSFLLCPAHS